MADSEPEEIITLGAELGAAFGKGRGRDFHTYNEEDGKGRRKIEITINENPPRGLADGETLAAAAARFMADAEQYDGTHIFKGWLVSECRYSEVYTGRDEPAFNSVTVVLLNSPAYGEK